MIRWTGLAPWEFEFPLPGSLIFTFLVIETDLQSANIEAQRGCDLLRRRVIQLHVPEFFFLGSLTSTFLVLLQPSPAFKKLPSAQCSRGNQKYFL